MDLIAEGQKKGLVRLEDGGKYIIYLHQQKRRNYENPEEQVQVDTFLTLALLYKYPPQRIRQFVPVQMGTETKEADIIVYNDDALKSPLIIVECKRPSVTELEFKRAADQAFSYAVAEGGRYVWITSGIKNEYYEVPPKKPKDRITITDVPQCGVEQLASFKYAYAGGTTKAGQKLFPLEKVTQDELTRRFQQAHQALWGGGELNPSEAFDELDKLIFCKLWDERKPRKLGEPYDFPSEHLSAKASDSEPMRDLPPVAGAGGGATAAVRPKQMEAAITPKRKLGLQSSAINNDKADNKIVSGHAGFSKDDVRVRAAPSGERTKSSGSQKRDKYSKAPDEYLKKK